MDSPRPDQAGSEQDASRARGGGEVTQLLQRWSQGDSLALEKLIPLVFADLRMIADQIFRREGDVHTLQPTALVNEVYLRLSDQRKVLWQNREQFFGVAALMMRRILVDYAKGRQAAKRGSGVVHVPLDKALAEVSPDLDLVNLDQALMQLAEIDSRKSQIVEMRFFVGLSYEEIAEIIGISVTTVKREWRTAKIWLFHELANR